MHPLFEKTSYTIGELYSAVLSIHDGSQARRFFEDYAAHNQQHAKDEQYRTPEGAAALARSNIGWIFGEGMPEQDILMWVEACGAAHPVFGMHMPGPEAAFQAGLALGKKKRR